jgi:hypothetical protein
MRWGGRHASLLPHSNIRSNICANIYSRPQPPRDDPQSAYRMAETADNSGVLASAPTKA